MSRDAKYMVSIIEKNLLGARILGAVIEETDDEYTQTFGFTVEKNGRKFVVWVQQDAEGNGPGWLALEDEKGQAIL